MTTRRYNIDVDQLGNPIDCPDREQHTEEPPLSYQGFFVWARKKNKTHKQTKCRGCDRYRVWVEREKKQ